MKHLKTYKVYEAKHINLIDDILDKINKYGIQSLSFDEKTYLKQHSKDDVDRGLEDWLINSDDDTFYDDKKLLYNEFEDNDDIFYNEEKLKRIISKILNKNPYTNNADWGGGYVWNINSSDNYIGTFLYLGDDELVLLKRDLDEDKNYIDEVLKDITNVKELNQLFLAYKKKMI